ncbi:unnamed protein product, partial [marine sediment metagenome]
MVQKNNPKDLERGKLLRIVDTSNYNHLLNQMRPAGVGIY